MARSTTTPRKAAAPEDTAFPRTQSVRTLFAIDPVVADAAAAHIIASLHVENIDPGIHVDQQLPVIARQQLRPDDLAEGRGQIAIRICRAEREGGKVEKSLTRLPGAMPVTLSTTRPPQMVIVTWDMVQTVGVVRL
ncbi:MAG: hypothetical protein H7245_22870 [Candidatus Saccharibacteria bacterium]|nr:hypothetical protein [Pseudorhodobacter sp.]